MISSTSPKSVSPWLTRIEKWSPGLRTLRTYKKAWRPYAAVLGKDEKLNAAEIHLIFAGLKQHVITQVEAYGLLETLDRRHFYPTIEVAVEEFKREVQRYSRTV